MNPEQLVAALREAHPPAAEPPPPASGEPALGSSWGDYDATPDGRPMCPHCNLPMLLIDDKVSAGVKDPFYSCDERSHKRNLNAKKWAEVLAARGGA